MNQSQISKKDFEDMVEIVDSCISNRVNIDLIEESIKFFDNKSINKNLFKSLLILKTNSKLEDKDIFKEGGIKFYFRLCDALEFYYSVNQKKDNREKIQLLNNIKEFFYV